MPIMHEHAYHEDFRKALLNYARQTSSSTANTLMSPDSTKSKPSTSIPIDQIQFRDPIENNPEAPVAQAIAQNLVPPTPTTEYPVRPSSIN